MTSVRNRLLPLSGNKILFVLIAAALLVACSPKVQPVKAPVKPVTVPPVAKNESGTKETAVPFVPVISLILPFDLDKLDLSQAANRGTLKNADMAAEYYQGFKLALDSLTAAGQSFKLQVFDSKDEHAQAYNLALNTKVRTSNLIVGPVYPDGLKSFSAASGSLKKMVVSPLSPAPPTVYKNPYLITMMPPLQYHCRRVATYINDKMKVRTVIILRSGYSEDNKYILPFKRAVDSLSKGRIKVVQLTVVRGNLSPVLPQLTAAGQNVFVIPSTDQQFLQVTLRSLYQLTKKYPVAVFGHPNWEKLNFLRADVLQHLHTIITSADRIDYHASHTVGFLKSYRRTYHAEPGEYAVKGFDEGIYFGRLLNTQTDIFKQLPDYVAIHNIFHFEMLPGAGWVNTHVSLYKYANFELKQVE